MYLIFSFLLALVAADPNLYFYLYSQPNCAGDILDAFQDLTPRNETEISRVTFGCKSIDGFSVKVNRESHSVFSDPFFFVSKTSHFFYGKRNSNVRALRLDVCMPSLPDLIEKWYTNSSSKVVFVILQKQFINGNLVYEKFSHFNNSNCDQESVNLWKETIRGEKVRPEGKLGFFYAFSSQNCSGEIISARERKIETEEFNENVCHEKDGYSELASFSRYSLFDDYKNFKIVKFRSFIGGKNDEGLSALKLNVCIPEGPRFNDNQVFRKYEDSPNYVSFSRYEGKGCEEEYLTYKSENWLNFTTPQEKNVVLANSGSIQQTNVESKPDVMEFNDCVIRGNPESLLKGFSPKRVVFNRCVITNE